MLTFTTQRSSQPIDNNSTEIPISRNVNVSYLSTPSRSISWPHATQAARAGDQTGTGAAADEYSTA